MRLGAAKTGREIDEIASCFEWPGSSLLLHRRSIEQNGLDSLSDLTRTKPSRLSEFARVLVRFDHFASFIVNPLTAI